MTTMLSLLLIWVILISKSFLLAHLVVKFEPISWFMEAIAPSFDKNKALKFLFNILYTALGCLKCSSLYVGWIIGGFWCGVITSFIAYLYSQIIMPKIDKIKFQ